MPNYQEGKIYKVWSPNTDMIYVGSTCSPLCKRMYQHRSSKNTTNSKKIIECGDAMITLIQTFPCSTVEELEAQEQVQMMKHLHEGEIVVNKQLISGITPGLPAEEWQRQYREIHKNKIKDYMKEYGKARYEANKETMSATNKVYRDAHKEERKEYDKNRDKDKKAESDKAYREGDKREELLQQKRDYRKAHLTEIAEKSKAVREANKEAIAAKKKADYEKEKTLKFVCECGCEMILRNKSKHMKSANHLSFLQNK